MNTELSTEKLNNLDIIETVQKGFELFQKNPVKLIVLSLIAGVVSFFSLGLLAGIMTMNFLAIVKRLDTSVEGSYDPEYSELFSRMDRFVDAFVLSIIILGVCILLNIVLWIISLGGSLIGSILIYSLIFPVLIISYQLLNEDEGTNSLDVFLKSVNFLKTAPLKALGMGAVLGTIVVIPTILGFFLSLILGFVTYSIVICSGRIFYKSVSN